ncbi:sensor histidine kinase [Nocardia caishijiensis]|uniref:histidine kinase n=1 Tax=Nocardia caishijiensis TaxID=184756 RepID=A0ABQ6YJQ1_9NOCA|nr:histidine kinase [Nocardia caishijiensis]KAF0845741.1 histidine kinase [Nocardia caishijiensis]
MLNQQEIGGRVMGRVAIVSALTAVITAVGVASTDWSPTAVRDPARALSLGPMEAFVADRGGYLPAFTVTELVVSVLTSVATVAAGLAIWHLRPRYATGKFMIAAGLLSLACLVRRSDTPALFTAGVILTNTALPIVIHLVLGYPSGHLRKRWEKVFVGLCWALATVGVAIEWLFFDPRLADARHESTSRNLLLIDHRPELASALQLGVGYTMAAFAIVLTGALITRWIRGTRSYRSEFAPVLVISLIGFVVLAVVLIATTKRSWLQGEWVLSFRNPCVVLLPLTAVVIVSRYRFTHAAIHTALTELGSAPLTDGFVESLRRIVHDPDLEILTYDERAGTYVDGQGAPRVVDPTPPGRAVTLVDRSGARVGAVLHDRALFVQRELRGALRLTVGLALEHKRLQRELHEQLLEVRESRARIVHAGDVHRQRIGRDLHDGAQQLLVTAILHLGRAQQSHTVAELRGHLDAGTESARTALAGLRELARGVYPATLTDYGLVAALNSLAERNPLPIELTSSLTERPGPTTELAAYYIAAEAITNAGKHADAEYVQITIDRDAADLVLVVRDDGRGGAALTRGGGLDGLVDRAGAIGGCLTVLSPAGAGTTVTATLPFTEVSP